MLLIDSKNMQMADKIAFMANKKYARQCKEISQFTKQSAPSWPFITVNVLLLVLKFHRPFFFCDLLSLNYACLRVINVSTLCPKTKLGPRTSQ